jgi:PPM family protein phosphatase
MSFQREIEVASLTHTGRVRAHNEDAIDVSLDDGLIVLADGMGGYNAGEIASKMCVDIVKQEVAKSIRNSWMPEFAWQSSLFEKWLQEAIKIANNEVLTAAQNNSQYMGMGTTVVSTFCYEDTLVVAHVGDSRVYRFRNSVLEPLTRDHSVLQAQIDAGLISAESAHYSPIKNLITRAVGAQYDLEVETHDHAMQVNDIYLLCSDGLSDMLAHDEIRAILLNFSGQLEYCCQALVDAANGKGGHDNISVVLVRINDLHKANKRSLLNRLF